MLDAGTKVMPSFQMVSAFVYLLVKASQAAVTPTIDARVLQERIPMICKATVALCALLDLPVVSRLVLVHCALRDFTKTVTVNRHASNALKPTSFQDTTEPIPIVCKILRSFAPYEVAIFELRVGLPLRQTLLRQSNNDRPLV